VSLRALAIDSDGLYRDVTNQSTWTTSDPGVLQVSNGGVRAVAPGLAEIAAANQGASSALAMAVTLPVVFPRLEIRPMPDPRTVGSSASGRAVIFRGVSNSQDVTSLAVWTSSTPSVVNVTSGDVTGIAIGTAEISVSYDGLSTAYRVSVWPRGF